MKVPVYFASLIFLLVWGNINSFNEVRLHRNYSMSQVIEQPELIKLNNTFQAFFTNVSFPREDKTFICEDLEDDDTNDSYGGKCRSAVGFYSIPSYQSCLYTSHNCSKAVTFLWRPVSCRYILLRTLRI